jgi:CRP-like cAMP-binding protein
MPMEKTAKKLQKFFAQGRLVKYKKRHTFLNAGDVPQGVHYIKKGYVRLYSVSPSGKEITLVIYEPGDFFPVVWGLQGKGPSIYYFETFTAVELQRVQWKEFNEFVNENLDVFKLLVDHILVRFQTSLKRVEYLAFGNSKAKVASVFATLIERFGTKKGGDFTIPFPMAHRDISTLAGLTRETTSYEISALKKNNILAQKRGFFTIKNLTALKKASVESSD